MDRGRHWTANPRHIQFQPSKLHLLAYLGTQKGTQNAIDYCLGGGAHVRRLGDDPVGHSELTRAHGVLVHQEGQTDNRVSSQSATLAFLHQRQRSHTLSRSSGVIFVDVVTKPNIGNIELLMAGTKWHYDGEGIILQWSGKLNSCPAPTAPSPTTSQTPTQNALKKKTADVKKQSSPSFPPIFDSLMAIIIMRKDAEEARHLKHGANEQLKAQQDELEFDRERLRFFNEHFEITRTLSNFEKICYLEHGLRLGGRAELGNRITAKEAEAASRSAACGETNRSRGADSAFGTGFGTESGAPAARGAVIRRAAAMGRGAALGHGAAVGGGAVIGPGAPVVRGAVMGGVAVKTIPVGNAPGHGAAVALHNGVGTAAAVVAPIPATPVAPQAVPLSLAPSSLATRDPSAAPTPPPMPVPTYTWGVHASSINAPVTKAAEAVSESHLPPLVPFSASTSSTPRPTPPQASRTDLKTRGTRNGPAKFTKRAV
ncbi:hypothetical protein BDK51DRAFT_35035 [Blyttiomyces helicus]|uniref:Uncharacterized protein n=1 Tax=Blyttiomyces helicus TaxID=388810 RepID=A0A4P9W930_9FUNG|nr:hypothetical protein BDK51DRAFT_35035 [Blyttiomyces helicus]|eukprot:RKO87608.1 hypothetical protein BDK51DRAFT_35035 [Blyttiomyces helicus]